MLMELSDEELCAQHPDTSRLSAPDVCRIPRWVNEKPTDCLHEAWWVLSNDRFGYPVTHGCTAGTAEYLRHRLWLDQRQTMRDMACSGAAIVLTPDILVEFARQVAVAKPCSACKGDPFLVIRPRFLRIYTAHKPGCAVLCQSTVRGGRP
ncbi:hypothetical protein EV192_101703 [Actinocrispum wychmicini]|uniref:Uncharacterized protein n=2 Tax=Actinocrispum wychmicini TaxID=1213861 RepID=A0A4R2K523_9PSEU|nr:hypothetical protein EV192_101703 [Actinocrispum wychmicini]